VQAFAPTRVSKLGGIVWIARDTTATALNAEKAENAENGTQ
jgi:hypothetical protein